MNAYLWFYYKNTKPTTVLVFVEMCLAVLAFVTRGLNILKERVIATHCSFCCECARNMVWLACVGIPLPCVQWEAPDDGQRYCPKRVESYSESKFENLVLLFGFIIRIVNEVVLAVN